MAASSAGHLSTRARWMTLAAMTLANSMILSDQTSVPLATPDLIQDLGGSISEGPWILTANILPLAALMVLGGRLGPAWAAPRVPCRGLSFAGHFVPRRERARRRRPPCPKRDCHAEGGRSLT
jgi:hypothetical protein